MPFTQEQIKDIFSYHAPDHDQQVAYETIRSFARSLAMAIIEETPPCADQSAAIRLLRECVMTANAAIALKGRF
jgi:hypothetical protein